MTEIISFQAGCITKLGYIAVEFKDIWAYEIIRSLYFKAQRMLTRTGFKMTSALAAVGSNAIGLNNFNYSLGKKYSSYRRS